MRRCRGRVAAYDKNRLALYNGLKELGFECIKPQGAFYLFVKSPVTDEKAFCEAGKKYNILMVPGSSFACPGYVRLAYCVSYDTIMNSLPQFGKLAERIRAESMISVYRKMCSSEGTEQLQYDI